MINYMDTKKSILPLLLLSSLLFIACGGSDDDDPTTTTVVPPEPPTATTLVFPENNTECNEGDIISPTESTVNFRWNASANTDSYDVRYTNLNTNSTLIVNSTTTSADITILRATPYSWSVTSKSNDSDQTAQSDTYRFYNAGLPEEDHPPFPATVINPTSGATIPPGNILLQWEGSDIDDDLSTYTILFDTNDPPEATAGSGISTTSLQVATNAGTVYYWMVISFDDNGNSSNSERFEFRTE